MVDNYTIALRLAHGFTESIDGVCYHLAVHDPAKGFSACAVCPSRDYCTAPVCDICRQCDDIKGVKCFLEVVI